MEKTFLEQILNDMEREKIIQFNNDPIMRQAVKKVLLAGIYDNGTLLAGEKADPTKNFLLSLAFDKEATNEQLGADVRAAAEGIRVVENAFNKLETIKPKTEAKKEEPTHL